jgi:hypothetical protein
MRGPMCAIALAALAALPLEPVRAQSAGTTCSRTDLADAVDKAGASLRRLNGETLPRLQGKMRQLQAIKGWSDNDYQDLAADQMADERIAELDRTANELLARIDTLGTPSGPRRGPGSRCPTSL